MKTKENLNNETQIKNMKKILVELTLAQNDVLEDKMKIYLKRDVISILEEFKTTIKNIFGVSYDESK